MRVVKRGLLALSGIAIFTTPSSAFADIVNISGPVAPPFTDIAGTGLCMASAISDTPSTDFGFLNETNYIGGMNSFIEMHDEDRDERVVRTKLDLSNNNSQGTQPSYGDFTDVEMSCLSGGCGFFINDANTAFGSRLRGFLNVPQEWVGQQVHIGFYVDDAISLTIYDSNQIAHPIMILAPQLGAATWRLTDSVIFEEPGIYPLELLFVEVREHAALEMSYLLGPGVDFERPANEPPVIELDVANFVLFPETMFFQTLSGVPSFPDLDTCQQCSRQFVNAPGNNDCDSGNYCNEAALCAPCDTRFFCGPQCIPCGGSTPFCANPTGEYECVECIEDEDCLEGFTCDTATNTCSECNNDDDCDRGEYCEDSQCTPCATSDSCAGNSCNCCPTGADGMPMECASLDPDGTPVCMECARDDDCTSGVCDVQIGRCVESLAQNERSDCCGPQCHTCPSDHPFCLPGPLGTACAQCRWDTDCGDGSYCQSGTCLPCSTDRRCGERCGSCGDDTPFCLAGQTPELSVCVGCRDNTECPSGNCNPTTNQCEPACSVSCSGDTPYCAGDQCVQCLADTHCPCNGTCDVGSNTCSSSCVTNADCLGNEHCAWNDDFDEKVCRLGPQVGQSPCSAITGCIRPLSCDISLSRASERSPLGGAPVVVFALLTLFALRRFAASNIATGGGGNT